jgi:hypothetical protein
MLWHGNECVRNKRISRKQSPVTIMIDQIPLENVEYFKNLGSALTNNGRCTCEIKSRISKEKAAFNMKKSLFTRTLDLHLRKKLVKFYIWTITFYGVKTCQVFLICCPKCPSFSTIQSYGPNVEFY